jgi:hypothetical protein
MFHKYYGRKEDGTGRGGSFISFLLLDNRLLYTQRLSFSQFPWSGGWHILAGCSAQSLTAEILSEFRSFISLWRLTREEFAFHERYARVPSG